MVTAVEVLVGEGVAQFVIPVQGIGPADPMHVRDISGVDPVTAEVIARANAEDGDFLTDTRLGKRNIVITVGLNPAAGYDKVEEARRRLYAYVQPPNQVKLQFTSTNRPPVVIEGVVESLKAPLFAKDPEAQISIICPKPNFVGKDPIVVTGTAGPNPTLTDFINPGDRTVRLELEIHHVEGSDVEYYSRLLVQTRDVRPQFRNFRLDSTYHYDNPNVQSRIPIPTITPEQYFYLNTNQGQKKVQSRYEPEFEEAYGELVAENLLRWVDLYEPWLYFSPGINQIRVYSFASDLDADPPYVAQEFPWTVKFYPQYGGL